MMTIPNSRRGSALLVVLGMLAFMLFSGLAFSVYMRQSRLPTSFLRRTTTTRQLAKAALAEAIEDIDKAIGNDPHPGLRTRGYSEGNLGNFWSHRVFMGYGTSSSDSKSTEKPADGTYYPEYVDVDETVPTLTLEGLAYLPPNLINEARYYTRRTPTAKWHAFWFDSGRYAYSAIDVSDYFDVNRVFADRPRAACGSRRVTFAHLFETGYDHKGEGTGAAAWDKLMEKYRSVDDDTDEITYKGSMCPFVSLADFNMWWGSQSLTFGGQTIQNPFCSFIETGIPYNCGESETDEMADKLRMMTFVTDGWFPVSTSSKNAKQTCNLEDGNYQPFKMADLMKTGFRPSVRTLATGGYKGSKRDVWFNGSQGQRLTVPDCAALWDYLDFDSVPISLCMPTVERVPMVCGVRPYVSGDVKMDVKVEAAGKPNKTAEKKQINNDFWDVYSQEFTYKLDMAGLSSAQKAVQVLLAYPFQEHGQNKSLKRNFKVDGRFSIFLTRGDGNSIPLRPSAFSAYPTKDAFAKSELTGKALLSFPISERTETPSTIVESKKDCPCYKLDMRVDSDMSQIGDVVLARVKYTWPKDKWPKDDEGQPTGAPKEIYPNPLDALQTLPAEPQPIVVLQNSMAFFPLTTTGETMKESDLTAALRNWQESIQLKANAAVWIRVRDADDHVVDFVPACNVDDHNMNGDQTDNFVQEIGGDGYGYPLLRIVGTTGGNNTLAYSLKTMHGDGSKGTLGTFALPDTKLLVSDPRYNHASENWARLSSSSSSGELKPEDWFDAASAHASGNGKDGDIYMSTSDAGYLQSIYELSFLPRMSNGFNDDDFGNLKTGLLNTNFRRDDYAASFGDTKDAGCMWRTYSPFGDENDFYDLEEIIVSGSGTKVNPYSDSTKVLMAAFANTPHDWRTASTNYNDKIYDEDFFAVDAATFNGKYAWNRYSSDTTGRLSWDCLEEFAAQFHNKVQSQKNWEEAFSDLDWSTDKRRLLNGSEELDSVDSDLYSVDKKFLYGFWRDCFAARQQLFLVFVRAEPMMMGGGVLGQTPPQLGARAVALVWRDPTRTKSAQSTGDSTSQSYAPHRSRILFYHQFD